MRYIYYSISFAYIYITSLIRRFGGGVDSIRDGIILSNASAVSFRLAVIREKNI